MKHKTPHLAVSSNPCSLVPLRSQYRPLHPSVTVPQSMLLPQCETPNVSPTSNKGQNYVSIYLIFISLDTKLEDKKILGRTIADIA
jgi:hypothetical protein